MDYVEKHPNEFPFSKAEDIPLDDKKFMDYLIVLNQLILQNNN